MSEQNELFNGDEERSGEPAGNSAVGEEPVAAATMDDAPEGLEKLPEAAEENLTEPGPADIAGGGIAGGEVRAVEPPPKAGSSNRLLILLLLAVILLGGGVFLLNTGLLSSIPSETDVSTVVVQPQAPIKIPIERSVEEVVMEQKPVAAADVKNQPAKSGANPQAKTEPAVVAAVRPKSSEIYSVLVGPYLSTAGLDTAAAELSKLGFGSEQTKGRGMVTMIRLLEGVYPPDQARHKLAAMKKKVKSAFLLPDGKKLALYAGSFADSERAERYRAQLAKQGIDVRQVASEIEMDGKMLLAVQADLETAKQIAEKISRSGFKTQVVRR